MQAIDSDTKQEILAFCEKPDILFLTFTAPGGEGSIVASSDLPDTSKLKKKAILTHKIAPAKITKEQSSVSENTIVLEISRDIMGLLNSYCHSIYLSCLSNPAN